MKTKQIIHSLFLFALLGMMIFSCKKNDDSDSSSSQSMKVKTTVAGRVVDESNNPVTGAGVELEGQIVSTDVFGFFLFKDISVTARRGILILIKPGMLKQYAGFKPSAGKTTYVNAIMLKTEGTFPVSGSLGGTVSLAGGASVTFPPNAFSKVSGDPYSGSVSVSMNYLNADDSSFVSKSPGRDMHAIDSKNEEKILESFGMMNIELTSTAGEQLQLQPGVTATLNFPIAVSQQVSAKITIPMWYFDTDKKLWVEDGIATKSGNSYTGSVSHFTWWNCDVPYPKATLQTRLFACDGITAQPNTAIKVNSISNAYFTNSLGEVSGDAPANYPSTFNISSYNSSGPEWTQQVTIPVLSQGQVYQAPDLIYSNTYNNLFTLEGQIVDCNNIPATGFVLLIKKTDNSFTFQYVTGNFSFMAVKNVAYKIVAIGDSKYGQVDITANQMACTTNPVGNIPICNSLASGNVNFNMTLTSTIMGTQSASYFIDDCSVIAQPGGGFDISLAGNDTSGTISAIMVMSVDDYKPGLYSWNINHNRIYFSANLNGIPVIVIGDASTQGNNTLINSPLTGGYVQANFSGNVNITSSNFPGTVLTGMMNGNFNVLRNN